MQRFQNRSTAVVITAVVVLLSILIGAGISLGGLRRDAERVFEYGSDGGWRGIEYDLREVASGGYNLIEIAERYLGENDVRIAAVEREISAVHSARKPGSLHAAAEELRAAISGLDLAMRELDLNDEEEALRQKTLANIEASYRRVDRSEYNAAATAFNETLEAFPANVLSGVVGVKPLELYE